MATMLLITSEQAFCFRLCSVASAFVMAPFVIALPPAFMDFIGGSIVLGKINRESEGKYRRICWA